MIKSTYFDAKQVLWQNEEQKTSLPLGLASAPSRFRKGLQKKKIKFQHP